jgi:cholesterol oxidase
MSTGLNRRRFIQNSLATAAALGVSRAQAKFSSLECDIEAVVVGSGFGGAVAFAASWRGGD